MQIGVVFPQTEIGADPGAIRAYAQRVDELGFDHILVYDHVLGADPAVHKDWRGAYDVDTTFHEPLVLFGFLAGLTSLELVSGVVILPQRQTALVAKQAAQVDVLTGGRFRLGVGIGWNAVEFEALGTSFTNRGRRMEEQVALMRRLWTERSVSFDGTYEKVTGAGLSPMPVQRPIPIWIGGMSPPAYERMGRIADGWFPQLPPNERLEEARAIVETAARDAGRDPNEIGMEGRVTWSPDGGAEKVADHVDRWRRAGATHCSVSTMRAGFDTVDAHLAALTHAAEAAGLEG